MRQRFMIVILSLLLVIFTGGDSFAKSGQEHIQIWDNVFGISDNVSRNNILPLWRTAQEVIDEIGNDYRDLRENFSWFTWGNYGHRLLFHWGFNADPKRYSPLVKQVRSCLKDNPDAREQERKFFSYLTNNIQSRRNRKLINAVTSVTGIPTARGYANAIATIIYDVHLLGDYETVKTSALPKIDDIERDLVENGFTKLITGGDKSERLEKIDAELKASIRAGRGRVNRVRAILLTEAVKKYLPQILNERFKKTLSEKGITITVTK
ncbi:MAG: hypothetical protein IJQ75_04110 [Synergistaceae bacterium]|nr:hypothetical protein [Synergistaceae bacterium]